MRGAPTTGGPSDQQRRGTDVAKIAAERDAIRHPRPKIVAPGDTARRSGRSWRMVAWIGVVTRLEMQSLIVFRYRN
ncbi:hypothetical protein [Methylobacterium platani]|uniref:hypothetical protein n=1 Tax=Methylobacterium platani TaxID=427683 RepID=UPI0012E1B168|nr:hypothetical protein [Methylobacterium platani]